MLKRELDMMTEIERLKEEKAALLEACEALLKQLDFKATSLDMTQWPNVQKARAAIAKANGESNV